MAAGKFIGVCLGYQPCRHLSPLSSVECFLSVDHDFLTLHTIGAHYTYEHALPGYWIKDALKLPRNPFDRIVHFSCGLLLAYPLREMVTRVAKTTSFWTYFFPLMIVMAISGFFEMLESWVARIVSPELGAAYLGTQGDVWDAQKDLTLATIGAFLSLGIIWLTQRRKRHERS